MGLKPGSSALQNRMTNTRNQIAELVAISHLLSAICYLRLACRAVSSELHNAHVAELADAYGSGPYGVTRGGSSPLVSMLFRGQTTRFQCRQISPRQIRCRFERCSDASLDVTIVPTKS